MGGTAERGGRSNGGDAPTITGGNSGGKATSGGLAGDDGSDGGDSGHPSGGTSAGGIGGGATAGSGVGGALNPACFEPTKAGGARSCEGLGKTCGAGSNQSCCDSRLVPGGTFNRINDKRYPATVSDFRFDTFEVTVGRFKKFVDCYPASRPSTGSGKNPNNPEDNGWDEAWNEFLPADSRTLKERLNCSQSQTFTKNDDRLPMTCLDWYVAQAFCIWDGGRLPTEAEWNYAAAGGDEQRIFPWSNPSTDETIDEQHAALKLPHVPVGSKSPLGDGRWGHADLAGSISEWTLDCGYSTVIYQVPCLDCANFVPNVNGRVQRGGGASASTVYARTITVTNGHPDYPSVITGVRCARAP